MNKRNTSIRTLMMWLAAAFAATSAVKADLVINGGFEEGSTDYNTPVGWNFTPGPIGINHSHAATNAAFAHSGDSFYGFTNFTAQDVDHADRLWQDIPTAPGAPYVVSFWVQDVITADVGTGFRGFQVRWDGNVLPLVPILTPTITGYTQYTFNVAGGLGTTTNLEFRGFNISTLFRLDDVSVNTVPAPGSAGLVALGIATMTGRRRAKTT